jgi:hypothetical protein
MTVFRMGTATQITQDMRMVTLITLDTGMGIPEDHIMLIVRSRKESTMLIVHSRKDSTLQIMCSPRNQIMHIVHFTMDSH